MAKKVEVKLTFKKSTKRTQVYEDVADDALVSTLYIKNEAFPDGVAPVAITVTITHD